MTTYSKETALYNSGAIASDINEAGTKASKFLSSDETGIMVYDGENGIQYPATVSDGTKNVFIDDNSMDIRNGQNILASFGANGAQIGGTESSRVNIESEKMQMLTMYGEPYFSAALEGGGIEPTTSTYILTPINTRTTNTKVNETKLMRVYDSEFEPLSYLSDGDSIYVKVKLQHYHTTDVGKTRYELIGERTIDHIFTKGTAETYDAPTYSISQNPDYFEYDFRIRVDDNNLSVYVWNFKRTVGNDAYNYRIVLEEATVTATMSKLVPLIEMHGKYNLSLFVDGAASKTNPATSGSDKDIFNAIRSLGWYDDIIE